MRCVSFFMAALLALPAPALAANAAAPAEKPVSRIDSLIATEKDGRVMVEAKGAVMGGGWKHAVLRPARPTLPADAHVMVLNFVAVPPDPAQAVIPGLLPVAASITLKARKGVVSVRVVSGSNEITTQILK
jgi:hypothetical protein